ncbi:hypothetical protein [Campylobacter sputorum]|nr:hypothetical protein [Campylobacter sputorum]
MDVLTLELYDHPLSQYNYGLEFVDFNGNPLSGYYIKTYKEEGLRRFF